MNAILKTLLALMLAAPWVAMAAPSTRIYDSKIQPPAWFESYSGVFDHGQNGGLLPPFQCYPTMTKGEKSPVCMKTCRAERPSDFNLAPSTVQQCLKFCDQRITEICNERGVVDVPTLENFNSLAQKQAATDANMENLVVQKVSAILNSDQIARQTQALVQSDIDQLKNELQKLRDDFEAFKARGPNPRK